MPPDTLPAAAPAAERDRYVVIGHPVAHSRSPFIHAAFAEATGQALHYDRLEAPLDGFAATLQAFADSREGPPGVRGPARGCNVTVPFKFEARALALRCTERARLAGAANTLRREDGGWAADNTDGAGLVRDIEHNAGRPLAGRRVLLLGAGGAAAGALGALLQARPARLRVVNRTPDKARALADRHADWAAACGVALEAGPLDDPGEGHDVVVNASASSLHGVAEPLDARALGPGALALDMMYGPAADGFLAWAQRHGAQPRDGLGMLVEQAAEAFAWWRGVRPQTAPVLAALRAALPARG
ncbi:shikimate dehydrogenase [Piscinibacter sakaiensis]|uniref:Shikimate dehydrogenase (NADP(+)) n=1 Tax=Piscinibacter sakaiensis TaxID=1547922 RepID=A0A0K8NXY8_PISS1|nr:shikimate dehydrogenase [Piscinibacter sakaiensis]GAP35272.1 shikimate 5-dehydrogenase I alpha [Piscinibacter sakaiensis]